MTPRPRVGSGVWVFIGLLLVLLAGGRTSFFRDPGTFWHVRTGELLLDGGRFFDADPYTFTFGGQPWTPYEWLGEVGMAVIHRAAGIDGLLLASCAVIAATFTILFGRLTRAGLHWTVAGCLTGLGVAAAAAHFHARPHLVTILFLAVTFLRLQDYEAGRIRLRGLFWLLPLFAVWTNIHGGVLGGHGTVGLAVAGWVLFRLVGWPSPVAGWRDAGALAVVAALLGLTVLATPYGLSLPRTWVEIMRMTELPHMIREHAPVQLGEPISWAFLWLGVVYLFVLAGLREKPRVTWLLPLVWFALGCERVRHGPLFAVTALAGLAELFPRTVSARRLAARPDLYRPAGGPTAAAGVGAGGRAAIAAVVAGVFALQVGRVPVPVVGAGWAAFPESEWPVGLVPALHREAAGRAGVPVFNEYEFGGFLIYFAPEYRPFVDDRCEVFGGPWLAKFVAADADPAPAMARWAAEYGRFDFALTHPGSGFDGYFRADPGWVLVEETKAGRFYRRKLSEPRP